MSVLIIALSFSLLFAFLATQNTTGASLRAGGYLFSGIPLYIVVLGSLLTGIVLSWILSLFASAANAMTLFGKDRALRDRERDVTKLEQRIHELEQENARLQDRPLPQVDDRQEYRPGILDRFRHNFS